MNKRCEKFRKNTERALRLVLASARRTAYAKSQDEAARDRREQAMQKELRALIKKMRSHLLCCPGDCADYRRKLHEGFVRFDTLTLKPRQRPQ